MSIKSKLISGTLISSTSTALVALIQLLTIPMLIKGLGAYEFGLIGIVNILSINGYLSIFDLGLTSSVQRFVSKYYSISQIDAVRSLIKSTFSLLLLVGTFLTSFIYFFSVQILVPIFHIDKEYENIFLSIIKVFSLSYIFQFPTLILQSSLLGLLNFLQGKGIVLFIEISKLIGIYFVLQNGGNVLDIMILYLGLHALNFVLNLIAIFVQLGVFNLIGISLDLIREIRSFTTFQYLGKIASIIFNQSDRFFIGFYLGPLAMSAFEIMMKIPSLMNMFLGLSMSAMVPVVGGIDFDSDRKLVYNIYKKGVKYYSSFIIPVITLAYFVIPDFIELWVGKDYLYLVPYVRLLLVWSFLSVLTFGSNLLVGLNRGIKQLLLYRVVQTSVKLLSLFLLIGYYGLIAVPLSFVLSMIPIIYLLIIYKKYLEIDVVEGLIYMLKCLVLSLIILLALRYLGIFTKIVSILDLLLVTSISLFLVWIFSLFLFFSDQERQQLKSKIKL